MRSKGILELGECRFVLERVRIVEVVERQLVDEISGLRLQILSIEMGGNRREGIKEPDGQQGTLQREGKKEKMVFLQSKIQLS